MTAPAPIDFEALLASSPNPYVLLDRELRIVWMNDAYLAVTMRDRGDIFGRKIFDAFPSDPASESFKLLDGSFEKVLRTRQADEIALIRYDILNPDGSMDVRYWSATHTPFLDAAGEVAHMLQHTVDVSELESLRRLRDEVGLVQRASKVQAQNMDLAAQAERLQRMFQQAPGFVAVLEGPEHVFAMANSSYEKLAAHRELVGKKVAEALPEVVGQGFIELLDTVRSTRTAYSGASEKVLLKKEGSDEVEERYLDFVYQPLVEDDQVTGIFVQGHDVTDGVLAFEAQTLLVNELNHRVKNTLAIIQGLASQSFRGVENAEAARKSFDARINALAAAHSLLTERNWDFASLADIVRGSVEAAAGSDGHRVSTSGPDVRLHPQTAVSLAMIVHELVTNAIKYGALSNEQGKVTVHWSLDPQAEGGLLISLSWKEAGGPPVTAPARTGFGSRLIRVGLSSERASEVDLAFEPDGLRCRINAVIGTEA